MLTWNELSQFWQCWLLWCNRAGIVESLSFLVFCKKQKQKILKTREMRTHLRRDLAPKSRPNHKSVFKGFSVVKCSKYNHFFHPRYKSTLNWSRFGVGPLFWARSRRRCVRISRVLNIFWFGFLQNARNYIDSTISARCSIKVNTGKTGTIRFINFH